MIEKHNGPDPEDTVTMLSRLRIRQRLGMVSTSNLFKEKVAPRIIRMGGQELPADEFIAGLDKAYQMHPDSNNGTGPADIARQQVPKIIDRIIENDAVRSDLQNRWQETIAENSRPQQ